MPNAFLEAVQAWLPVSRETSAQLAVYAGLLRKWNQAINLVGPRTIDDMWRRHFLDSAQLIPYLPKTHSLENLHVVDLGSGAGFPGLVLGLLTGCDMTLVESDRRKGEFLRKVIRDTECSTVRVLSARIENASLGTVDVVTARALAPLHQLLPLAEKFTNSDSVCLFLKGNTLDTELTEAKKVWHIESIDYASLTHPEGRILRIDHFTRRGSEATQVFGLKTQGKSDER